MSAVLQDARPRASDRAVQYALSLSDVDFLLWARQSMLLSKEMQLMLNVELQNYEFIESDLLYAAHYAKHEGKFYDGPVHEHVAKDWARDERYLSIRDFVRAAAPRRVLDYGCSTGHITRQLAREMPDVEFVGVDLVPQAIEWFNGLAPKNARAVPLREYDVQPMFDLVILAEVLEHVREPYKLLDDLASRMAEPMFVCTLPQGPWESLGWAANPGAREHVRHWSGDDLREVFGDEMAIRRLGGPLGHCVTYSGMRVGKVSMVNKATRYEREAEVQGGS